VCARSAGDWRGPCCSEIRPPRAAKAPVLPLSYAVDAMDRPTAPPGLGGAVAADLAMVPACTLPAPALGAVTLRRRTE
jgi:hypothetical protein